ncbi:TOX high mobility group box family member 4 [Guaruba guarouba]
MEFPGGNDNYLAITGTAHPFLTGAETFHTPSLGDEEFEIPPISLDSDPSLAVSDVVGHFEDLGEPGGAPDPNFPPPPYGVQGLEMPVGISHGLMEQGGGLLAGGLAMELEHTMSAQYSAAPPVTIDVPMAALSPGGLLAPGQLTTIDQSELSSQLGLSLGANGAAGTSAAPGGTPPPPPPAAAPSPEDRLSPPPSPAGSGQEEEAEEFRRTAPSPPAPPPPPPPPDAARRGKPPKKAKKKKDPNEPQKPVSAYALFFRDTQAAIKGQNPNATFGEVSKIVASMWDSLGEEQKQVYKRKTEAAKKEYLKALAAYRAVLTSSDPADPDSSPTTTTTATAAPPPPSSPAPSPPPPPPPTAVAQILIPKQLLAVIPVRPPAPRLQPPPLQQMPPPVPAPPSQGGALLQAPPPLQAMQAPAAPGGGTGTGTPPPRLRLTLPPPHPSPPVPSPTAAAPPAVHIKILPPLVQPLRLLEGAAAGGGGAEEEEVVEMVGGEFGNEAESPPALAVELVPEDPPPARCIRAGCGNAPVASAEWDEEYCSSECVVRHCRDVFLAWLSARNAGANSVVFVK